MDTLFFDIVTSVPRTTLSRMQGQRHYPARLLQVALINQAGELLYKSYVQPAELDWEETSDGTYLSVSDFKRKRYPTQQQVIEQLRPLLQTWEVVVYGLSEKWEFVHPFIHPIRQKWCSRKLPANLGRWGDSRPPTQPTFSQELGEILFTPHDSADTGKRDAESVAMGSRALWRYRTDPTYRAEVEARREYYRINPIVEKIIYQERLPQYEQRSRVYQQLEARIFDAAHIILPDREREREGKASASTFCCALTGYSLYEWETYGTWLAAPVVTSPYPTHLVADYKIKRMGAMQPTARLDNRRPDNRQYHGGGSRYTFLFDLSNYQLGVDYVPIVDYPPGGMYSISALKKQFRLKEAQVNGLLPAAHTHGLWGEYFLYRWPVEESTHRD
ncbi:hypothetical protein CLV58_1249 [Spirosoma oryzae]|uniref:Uncharacterized protein n=1 Tax=Spirosoma oryzae TaxID=1469603 RepID=A0A2T0SAE8_9BACT|nr:hypothetical protein [Spirosoma oryzae]PRY30388.1 hypothetical protein CLV58_1249 [Spirosoma oryzae]